MPPQSASAKNAAPFNPNQSPKQRLLSVSQWVGEHRQMVDSPAFTRACDLAMLQYQHQATKQIGDLNTASAAGLKMQGAIEFIAILKNLSETAPPPTQRPDDNLQH